MAPAPDSAERPAHRIPADVDLSAFAHDGGSTGVLVCHGFTGSPQGMRPLARAFAEAGYTVRLPLLPGHGTTWRDLNRTTWRQWYGTVEHAFVELQGRCDVIILVGLSMGGTLVTRIAELHPGHVDGLVLVNPAFRADDRRLIVLPALRWLIPSLPGIGNDIRKTDGEPEWCYDRLPLHALHSQTQLWQATVRDLPQLDIPVLLAHSAHDHIVPPSSWRLFLERATSAQVSLLELSESAHVATLDHDAKLLSREALAFVRRLADQSGTAR